MFHRVVGKEGMLIRVAPAGADKVVVSFGGGPKRLATARELVAKGQAPLATDPGVKRVSPKLATARTGEFYLAVDNALQLVKSVMTAVGEGEEFPFAIKQINAPLAYGTSVTKDASRLDVFIPMELVLYVKDLVMQAMGAAMGGAMGPG